MSTLKLTVAENGIAVVTLANPPMNAMDAPLLEKLSNLFEGLAADRAVRAAVIVAEGPAFSAGLNLKTVPGLDRLGQRRLIDALNDSFGTLYAWPKPLVAAVNGHAIAGGLILALCADWRIVADAPLQISLAEVRVGVTYPVAPLQIARAELAPSAARRLILLGEAIDAAAAEALAIMDERVPPEILLARAVAQAERHAGLPPQAFATTKRELRATELERIGAARAGQGEPRLAAWLGDEMRRASAAVLRASSAVLRGAA
ncbi:MAG: enoyl-CoA hydratase/isomerase family protein [Reyranella sp.]|nr:enoyl-CoA hydratase/isomerase family protein [Reyranella sp.]